MHDQTAVRTAGITGRLRRRPAVKAEVDDGHPGLTNELPDHVSAPPRKPKNIDEPPRTEQYGWCQLRRPQSSRRICVQHVSAGLRQWHPLRRHTGRRETYNETRPATAVLDSDPAARRAAQHKPGTGLVPHPSDSPLKCHQPNPQEAHTPSNASRGPSPWTAQHPAPREPTRD
ncbi:hypothetical protein AB0C68_30325 [Streptomyces tendae]|uniref:hypothetical protein n=1 Tax=Streptomyces tendae TaxID=1932 RepID=UPI0033E5708C